MAVPTNTTFASRIPSGIKLKDGFRSVFVFNRLPTFSIWEKEVTPIGMTGGPKIEQTTMLNSAVCTYAAQALADYTDSSGTCAYDPIMFDQAQTTLLNAEGSVSQYFADLSCIDFFGYLQELKPTTLVRGKQPEATFVIVCTNFDPVNKVEQKPVVTSVANT